MSGSYFALDSKIESIEAQLVGAVGSYVTLGTTQTISGDKTITGDLTLNRSQIHLGTGSGVNQGARSIAIGENAGIGQAANCIQLNSTGANITQPTASSCVIAPIRNTTPNTTGEYSLPLLYNITSKELFNNNLPTINLTAVNNTADNSYYNSFIIISGTIGSGTVNIPTPIVDFPAYIYFYNDTNTTKTLTVPSPGGITRIFSGVASSTTFIVPIGGIVRLDTNGSVWYLTSSGGLASILNSIQFGYSTAPNFTTSSLGYNINNASSTPSQSFTFAAGTTIIAGCSTSFLLPEGVYFFNVKIVLSFASAAGNQATFDIYEDSGSGASVFSYNYITPSTTTFSDITFSYIYQVNNSQTFSLRATANTASSSFSIGSVVGSTFLKLVRIG